MKKLILAGILLVLSEKSVDACDCKAVGNFAYMLTSRMGRNDFLYLAYANSVWFMEHKLQREPEDRDKYYRRYNLD